MNQQAVERIVRKVVRDLEAEGQPSLGHFTVNPMFVWIRIERDHPNVVAHIRRYQSGSDPYQVIKTHMPTR